MSYQSEKGKMQPTCFDQNVGNSFWSKCWRNGAAICRDLLVLCIVRGVDVLMINVIERMAI